VLYLLTTEEQERGFKPFSLVLSGDRLVFVFRKVDRRAIRKPWIAARRIEAAAREVRR
jgi:hypothetical protein